MAYYEWRPYVPVAARQRQAAREIEKRKKKGQAISPVVIEGRKIADTFWGAAWCDNLESYSDYENRLPRGRTYVRNGSVVDLQIARGEIRALVSGSSLYEVKLTLKPVVKERWESICADCGGAIDSLVELLQGRLSKGVMERICRKQEGLFPAPAEIKLSCSCPDGAYMCKHVAAVLYGVGARLDQRPELLFLLRGVNEKDLIASAGQGIPLSKQGPKAGRVLGGGEDLADIFGLEIEQSTGPDVGPPAAAKPKPAAKRKAVKKAAAKKVVAKKVATKKGVSALRRGHVPPRRPKDGR